MATANRLGLPWSLVAVLVVFVSSTSAPSVTYYCVVVPLAICAVVLSVLGATLWLTWRGETAPSTPSGGTSATPTRLRLPGSTRQRLQPLYFTSPATWSMTRTKASWESAATDRPKLFPDAPPLVAAALDELLSLITRDFIVKWYSSMSDSPVFPNAVERTISESLVAIAHRVANVDWSDVLVGRILPLLTSHLDTFRAAEQALGRHDLVAADSDDELDLFLASRYSAELKSGKLHPAVDVASPNSRPAEEASMRSLVAKILPLVVPERELESPAVAVMVREIVSCAVLIPVFDMLGDSDFWNRIIDEKVSPRLRNEECRDILRCFLPLKTGRERDPRSVSYPHTCWCYVPLIDFPQENGQPIPRSVGQRSSCWVVSGRFDHEPGPARGFAENRDDLCQDEPEAL